MSMRAPDAFLLLSARMVQLDAESESGAEPHALQARIDVYRYLLQEGWQPPERIRWLLDLNELILELDLEQWLAATAAQPLEDHRAVLLPPPSQPSVERRLGMAGTASSDDDTALVAAYARAPLVHVRDLDPVATRLVADAENDLRQVVRPLDATRRLVALVQGLGGDLAAADEQDGDEHDPDVLPLDLSFATGPRLLPRAKAFSLARVRLERHLPALVEVARQSLAAVEG